MLNILTNFNVILKFAIENYFLDYRFALGFQPREVSKKLSCFRRNDDNEI